MAEHDRAAERTSSSATEHPLNQGGNRFFAVGHDPFLVSLPHRIGVDLANDARQT